MKKTLCILGAALTMFAACKKDDKTTPGGSGGPGTGGTPTTPTTPTTPKNPYYYSLNFAGKDYNISGGIPQYMFLWGSQFGGWEIGETALFPSPSIEFMFRDFGAVPHTEVMALAGKTFYFDFNAKIYPQVSFQLHADSTDWTSHDTLDHQFYVRVDSIRYLHPDTSISFPLDVYVISGSCNALMEDWSGAHTGLIPLKNGKFHFVVSRRVLD